MAGVKGTPLISKTLAASFFFLGKEKRKRLEASEKLVDQKTYSTYSSDSRFRLWIRCQTFKYVRWCSRK